MNFYSEYKALATADFEKTRNDAKAMRAAVENSSAHYHGNTVHTLYIPKMYSKRDYSRFLEITETTYTILGKVIKEYLTNPEYRRLFGFDSKLEELILRPSLYENLLPIARIDVFYNPENGSIKFCEFNTDGSSGMNEDRELNNVLRDSKIFNEFSVNRNITPFELFDSWVREFTDIYKSTDRYKSNAHIAIADFMSSASNEEFEEFKRAFERAGYTCEICDIYKLKRENGSLISPSGKGIDAVYRRAVTCDIIAEYDKIQPFIKSALNNEVVLIGDFKTQIVHNKLIFKILREPMTKKILTDKENEFIENTIPKTYVLSRELLKNPDILKNRTNWIAKPMDSYASKGVLAGIEAKNDDEWKNFLSRHTDGSYLLQEYITPYESENIDLLWDNNAEFAGFANITGLFVYNGKLGGLYSRISKTGIISTQYSEMTLPTMIVE